jgi:hypothetical protein
MLDGPVGRVGLGGYRRGHSMTRRALPAVPRASLVILLSALALISIEPGRAAEGCSAAPKLGAPQGSHWYYRLDRASQRKCWYLAANGQKVRPGMARLSRPATNATRASSPAALAVPEPPVVQVVARGGAEPSNTAVVAPTPQAAVSRSELAASVAERSLLAEPQATPPRQGSNWLVTAAEASEDSTAPQPAIKEKVLDRIVPTEHPAIDVKTADVATRAGFGPFQFGLVVLAALCLLACAGLYFAGGRPGSGKGPILDLNAKAPLRRPEPRISPRAPAGADTLEDAQAAIEARLRRFAQAWKRQAA